MLNSKMFKMPQFCAIYIIFVVLACAKLATSTDNTTETRSSVSESYAESSVVNDNICNSHEKTVAFDVILFDNNSGGSKTVNKREASRDSKNDFKDRPRPDQRSLLIVFDATGSMHDDLAGLRGAVQEIVKEFSARQDNPIYNYVLVVYRDPRKFAYQSTGVLF